MSYIDKPFPPRIALGAVSTTDWAVSIVANQAGYEKRNLDWSAAKHHYDVSLAIRTESDFKEVRAHWHMVRGRAHTFPLKDPVDYRCEQSEGAVAAVAGTVNQFQFYKRYGTIPDNYDRKVTRPRAGYVTVYRNGLPVTAGAGAGQYSLDTTTGKFIMVADQTRTINSHTVGATHRFTLASALSPNVIVGNKVTVSGVTGTAAALLNGLLLTVSAVSGALVNVSVNTTGLTATGGTLALYPDFSILGWSGQFWTVCRYDSMGLPAQAVNRNGAHGEILISADSLPLVEVRE